MKTRIPPYLRKGDTIGIVAPSGYMDIERMQKCIEILDSWGYTVQLGKTTHSNSASYFSGTDEERLQDLQECSIIRISKRYSAPEVAMV
jgi:muramoyltetrapeptide carboxypeptidase